MHQWLLLTIRARELRLQTNSHTFVRLGTAIQLFALYIVLATTHAVAVLFLSPQDSFAHFHQLVDGVGYRGSYIEHRQWKHNLRFGTLSYSLVLVCGVMTIMTLFSVINSGEFTPQALAANLTVNKAADTNDGTCDAIDCSLREAVGDAAAGDTILFSGNYTIALVSTLAVPAINNLTIDATGRTIQLDCAPNTIDIGLTLAGTGQVVKNLAIISCNGSGVTSFNAESATLDAVTVKNNTANASYKGILTGKKWTIQNSTISCSGSGVGIEIGIGDDSTLVKSTGIDNCMNGIVQIGGNTITVQQTTFTTMAQYAVRITGGTGAIYDHNVFGAANKTVHGAVSIGQNSTGNKFDSNTINYNTGNNPVFFLDQSQLNGVNNLFTNNTIVGAAVAFQGDRTTNNRFSNNTITNCSLRAFWLYGVAGALITGNIIGTDSGGNGGGNTVSGTPTILDLQYTTNAYVKGNTFTGDDDPGFDIQLKASTLATVTSNTISGPAGPNPGTNPSIQLDGTTNSTISNNTITTPATPGASTVTGINLFNNSSNNTISNNTLAEQSSNTTGIKIASSDNVVSTNIVSGTGVIGVDIAGSNNKLSNNTISGSIGVGVNISGTSTANIIGVDASGTGVGNTIGPVTNSEIRFDGSGVTKTLIRGNTFIDSDGATVDYINGAAASMTAPTVLTHSTSTITGTALALSLIDVYGKSSGTPFSLTALGSATTTADGDWTFTSVNLANYLAIAVTATLTSDGTSEVTEDLQPVTDITMTDPVIAIDGTTATFTWTTNIVSTSIVGVGTDDTLDNDQKIEQLGDSVTAHTVVVSNLLPNTIYNYQATSSDSSVLTNTVSKTGTFTSESDDADVTNPVISNVAATAVDYSTVTITWETNEVTSSSVAFGLTDQYGDTKTDSNLVTSHTASLTQLDPATTYHYQITATDAADNTDVTNDKTVTTPSIGETVVTNFTVTGPDGTKTITPDTTGDVPVQFGDLTLRFKDETVTLKDYRVHFVMKRIEQGKVLKQATVNRNAAINKKGVAEVKVKVDKIEVRKKYALFTGLRGKTGAAYVNETGLLQRGTLVVTAGPPTIISPATTIMNGMVTEMAATTQDSSVTFAVYDSTGALKVSCTGTTVNGLAQCTFPFTLPLGEYTLVTTSNTGATRSQPYFVSRLNEGAFTTDSRADTYLHHLTYLARPTFTGLTVVGHTVTVNGVVATVKAGKPGAVTTWKATLTTDLPAGQVSTITIIDEAPDHTKTTLLYKIYRPFRPVTPHIFSPASDTRYLEGDPMPVSVGGPNDHRLEVTDADTGTVLFTAFYSNRNVTFDASAYFSSVGTHHLTFRNKNAIGLNSPSVNLTLITYRPAPVVVEPTTPAVVDPTDPVIVEPVDPEQPPTEPFIAPSIDTDGDGVPDDVDADLDNDTLANDDEATIGTDPTNPDTDGDTISDGKEVLNGTDPLKADTDGDGLTDITETTIYKTDPTLVDTDGDTLSDVVEEGLGTDASAVDSDGDGVSDADELKQQTDPLDSDTDDDNITDALDPVGDAWDADGDGVSDGDEVDRGTDPEQADGLQVVTTDKIKTLTTKLQDLATKAYVDNPVSEPINYPLITEDNVALTTTEREVLKTTLTEAVINNTKLEILPGASAKVLSGEAKVVSVDREIGINDIVNWVRQSPDRNVTASLQGTYVVLSGQNTSLKTDSHFVLITLFSAPVVRIAKVDNSGRWTMTVPAELLSVGQHSVYVASETDGIRSDQIEVARFVIQQNNHLSKTTWLVIINLGIALLALIISIVLQIRKRRLLSQVTNS